MRHRSVSIVDVARHAGVAVGTVSRALNGGPVSPTTRERVEASVEALGYVPSQMARNLKLRRTGIVGLVAQTSQAPWFTLLLHGVETALRRRTASVALCSLELTGEYDASPVEQWIRERRVDGVLFVRSGRRERALVRGALDSGLAVSLIAPDEHPKGALAFRLDNELGGREAGEHLRSLGHDTIAFFGGPESSVDTQGRLKGLHQAGLVPAPKHVHYAVDYAVARGEEAGERYLKWRKAKRAPTAVVCANDAMAIGFLRVVVNAGVEVPGEVSVVGFDDVPEASLAPVPLTTIAQPVRRMGDEACSAVIDKTDHAPTTVYPMNLVLRKSTGPAR